MMTEEETSQAKLSDVLREAREERGLTVAELEEASKVRRNQLEALEQGNYDELPPPVFLRGLLRNLATHLGLDAGEVLALYSQEFPQASGPPPVELTSEPLTSTSLQIVNWLLIGALIAALGFAAYWAYQQELWKRVLPLVIPETPTATAEAQGRRPPATATFTLPPSATPEPTETARHSASPTAASTSTPVPTATRTPRAATPTSPAAATGELQLSIEATERVWLRVIVDGDQAFTGILDQGESQSWAARERIMVRSGNAGGTRLTLNDQPPIVLGDAGQVVERTWVLASDGAIVTTTPAPTPTAAS